MRSALLVLCGATAVAFAGEPPPEWRSVLNKDPQLMWEHCSEGGGFQATRLLGIFRTLGSQHDGDRQLQAAQLLAQVPEDPRDALRHYLRSPDPYDRVFAIQVITHLGDRRFIPELEKLTKDPAGTTQWDGPYDSVSRAARLALDQLRRGTNLVKSDTPFPKWLEAARKAR
jgi:hypothetical protein